MSHGAACRYADKSGVTVITDLNQDDEKILKELNNPQYYDILPHDPTHAIRNKVKRWSEKWSDKGQLADDVHEYVNDTVDAHPGSCKPLVKTHKAKPFPFRLLLSGCGTPVQPISKFVQTHIAHLTDHLPFQILDTKEFLQKINLINEILSPLPNSACFATCDVISLYPNVNNNMGIPAIRKMLKKFPSPHNTDTKCITEALSIALDNNVCQHSDGETTTYARPNQGTAMGPNHACDYVDVFMSELDEKLVLNCPVPLLSSLLPDSLKATYRNLDWSRFRDDGFTILPNAKDIEAFSACLQSLHPTHIKWTVVQGHTATYLDVALESKGGKISTDVFSKHNHSYLPPNSCHSPSVFKGFIQGIGTRLRMIISDDVNLRKQIEQYAQYLTLSGWPYKTAKCRLEEGAAKNRDKLLSKPRKRRDRKVAWVTTFDPRAPSKSAIIKKHLHLLYANESNKDIFPPKRIIAADRRRPNIGEWYKPTVPKRFITHGPANKPGFYPCHKKCDTCRHSMEMQFIKSPWDGRKWTIKQHLTCETPNVVYVVICEIHNVWYVGSTVNIKARWRNHKSDAKLKKAKKCGVAEHVTKVAHPDDPDFSFLRIIPIEAVVRQESLLNREIYWTCNLGTIFKGMNSRSDVQS